MKIYSINYAPIQAQYNTQSKQNSNKNTNTITNNASISLPNFAQSASIQSKISKNSFESFLMKPGKVTVKEFQQIRKNNPKILTEAENYINPYEEDHELTPEIVAKTAYLAKRYEDSQYGQGHYRIISIGTSPAILTYAMSALGCEVTHLPISGLKQYCQRFDEKNTQIAMDYLKTKNINNKKLNIITDYASSGASLRTAGKLIRSTFPYCEFTEIETQALLDKATIKGIKDGIIDGDEENEIANAFNMDQLRSNCDRLCNVPHFYVNDYDNLLDLKAISSQGKTEKDIFRMFENYSMPYARAFELCTLNELYNMGLLR
ncbi:hypothetical protein IJ425_05895 [bacterium]|nr:hypothetical protein [bacterium]